MQASAKTIPADARKRLGGLGARAQDTSRFGIFMPFEIKKSTNTILK
jgi:hypothetical protein